jgi:HemK-like putative methylase
MTQEEVWLLKEKYAGEKTEGFFADCGRLKHGEPLAYLIGSIPFLNTTIYLDSRPLIPRTETEFWVEHIISLMKLPISEAGPRIILGPASEETHPRVLDLCAGSGCIGVAVLKNVPNAVVDFVEIDTVHHETIRKNILENDIDISRTNIFGGDIFEHVTDTYDYILSNPPYIDPAHNQTDENVKKYEPAQALYAENAGLEIIFRIIDEASKFLTPKGVLVIEHDPEQSKAIQAHANNHNFIPETHPDQFGIERFTVLKNKKFV